TDAHILSLHDALPIFSSNGITTGAEPMRRESFHPHAAGIRATVPRPPRMPSIPANSKTLRRTEALRPRSSMRIALSPPTMASVRSEEHTSELQSRVDL